MSQLTARFTDAFAYAHIVHGGAVRKGTAIPYIAHLMGVTSLVLTRCSMRPAILRDVSGCPAGTADGVAEVQSNAYVTLAIDVPPRHYSRIDDARLGDPGEARDGGAAGEDNR